MTGVRRADAPMRIAVIGAECTGKTQLCEALATRLPGAWAPEPLRAFCDAHGRTPRPHEQSMIVARQQAAEAACAAEAVAHGLRHAVFDSAPLVTAAYSVFCFDDPSLLEAAVAHQRGYDLTLRADVDLPWVADGIQRDGPEVRARFDRLLYGLLERHALPFVTVRGEGGDRLEAALAAVARVAQATRVSREAPPSGHPVRLQSARR